MDSEVKILACLGYMNMCELVVPMFVHDGASYCIERMTKNPTAYFDNYLTVCQASIQHWLNLGLQIEGF